uniref:L-threonylcarbamoyladenylate synthase n=1 Tax=Nitrospira cf. moscoviensis SBR1015 TaxID=96242 RepID=UPI00117D31AF
MGGLVAFPTETVYGLGCDALNPDAAAKVFEAKQRPRFDPLIVHITDRGQLGNVVSALPATARQLIDQFWPGPLTLVLPKQPTIPDLVTAGLDTV